MLHIGRPLSGAVKKPSQLRWRLHAQSLLQEVSQLSSRIWGTGIPWRVGRCSAHPALQKSDSTPTQKHGSKSTLWVHRFRDPGLGFACGGSGSLFKTTDGGKSWKRDKVSRTP